MSLRTRGLVTLALGAVSLVSAVAARAETVLRQDAAGRTITFDVLAAGVDVDWYAGVLSAAAHGNEISGVTIRIVAAEEVAARCGAEAAACYERRRGVSTITVPAGRSEELASVVLHEYGHHLDASWAVSGTPELNGTPAWWASRGMAGLLQSGAVAFDYSLGWERSIAEVFAEDYAYVQRGGPYAIPWLAPPDATLRAALLAELGSAASGPPPAPPAPPPPPAETDTRPVVVSRSGTLSPRSRRTIPFQLLGPGRRVTLTASVTSLGRFRPGARVEMVCGNTVRRLQVGRRATTLDVANLGPAACAATIVSTSSARQRYAVQLRLALS